LVGAAVTLAPASATAQPPAPPPEAPPPRVVYGWDPDVPPPKGYVLHSDMNTKLLGGGVGLLGAGYLAAVLAGAVGSGTESRREWWPLFVPVAGPLIAMSTLEPSAAGTGLLVGDAVFQLGGVLGIALSFVDREHKIIRVAGAELEPATTAGLGVKGSF
jgi:hypothetical protein